MSTLQGDTKHWYYKGGIVYDPVAKKAYDSLQIRFNFKYISKADLESSSITGTKDRYPRSDYYAVAVDYLP